MARKKPTEKNTQALGGLRRARHFAEGGSQHSWRGGLAHRIPNKKRKADREACRKFTLDD